MIAQDAHENLDTALAQGLEEDLIVVHPVLGLRIELQERCVAVGMVVDVAREKADHVPQQTAVFELERQGVERIGVVRLEEEESLGQVVALVAGGHRSHVLDHVEAMALLEDHALGFEDHGKQITLACDEPVGNRDRHFERHFGAALSGGEKTVVGESHLVGRIELVGGAVGLVVLRDVIFGVDLGPGGEALGGSFRQDQTQVGRMGRCPKLDGSIRLAGSGVLQQGARLAETRFDGFRTVPLAHRHIFRTGAERSGAQPCGCDKNAGFEIFGFHT